MYLILALIPIIKKQPKKTLNSLFGLIKGNTSFK